MNTTELHTSLDEIVPPSINDHAGNILVWLLAFAPLIGLGLEYCLASAINPDNTYLATKAITSRDYWYITLPLTIMFSYWDEKRLQKMGANTKAFNKWALLVPVYLYQRAKLLKQNLMHLSVWIICFMLSVAIV